MSRRVWIIGPVAIDIVAYVDSLPRQGSFTRPKKIEERLGGSSANVAIALASAGIETGFISYIGDDGEGAKIEEHFSKSAINHLHLQKIDGPTNRALVMVDQSGDRTIVSLSQSHLSEVTLDGIDFDSDDIVVFSLWRPFFIEHLRRVQSLGCMTILGLEALADRNVSSADCLVGSEAELMGEDPISHLDRFPRIVVTRGAAGSDEYTKTGVRHQPSLATAVVDATGAGDSFLAGFLRVLARGSEGEPSEYGARWAAASLAIEGSQPAPPPL
jgi:sugar/nucleoside kinase (ribokinase family)